MARTSRRQPNSYRGGRVVGNLAYDERYAERRAPRRESEQREQPREEFIRPPRRQEKKAVRPRVRERQRVSGVLVLGFAALACSSSASCGNFSNANWNVSWDQFVNPHTP